ncbi:MAG: N-acetyltransferase family protein, partial [Gaiellaceae bacterium]
ATPADTDAVVTLFEAMDWDRPWPRPQIGPKHLEGKLVLVAEEDGEIAGFAFGETEQRGRAHLNVACVRPESRRRGVMKALLAEFAVRARAAGSEHVTLDVDTSNEVGRVVWQRLGFTEFSQRLVAPVDALEARLSAPAGESRATVYVQTDDRDAVEAGAAKYLPRLGGSGQQVSGPENGWTAVRAELLDRDRRARERFASELSNATAAVVCTLALEDGRLVRYVLYERGSVVDEYQSVPEYYGPVPPGDVVALGANATVVSRLTGADPARVRAVARTAASPEELPPAPELLQQIAELLGLSG